MTLNNVDDLKQWLSTSEAVNEGYTNDRNPAVYAASNQTLANLDTYTWGNKAYILGELGKYN
jgi:hypothetical protein